LTLIKPLDHENAAVILFRAEVSDVNADPEFANQTDTGKRNFRFKMFFSGIIRILSL
jgi:hypothetical protein